MRCGKEANDWAGPNTIPFLEQHRLNGSVKLGTEPPGDGFSGQTMTVLIPVTLPEGLAGAVEIDLMLGSVFLEGWPQ